MATLYYLFTFTKSPRWLGTVDLKACSLSFQCQTLKSPVLKQSAHCQRPCCWICHLRDLLWMYCWQCYVYRILCVHTRTTCSLQCLVLHIALFCSHMWWSYYSLNHVTSPVMSPAEEHHLNFSTPFLPSSAHPPSDSLTSLCKTLGGCFYWFVIRGERMSNPPHLNSVTRPQ